MDRADNICRRIQGKRVLQIMAKNLLTTKCECGHQFGASDIKPPLFSVAKVTGVNDPGFYGGIVKKCSKAKCPQCGKEYYLYLIMKNGGLIPKDMQPIDPGETEIVDDPLDGLNRREMFAFAKKRGIKIPTTGSNEAIREAIEKALKKG
jgi:hypothetical protein